MQWFYASCCGVKVHIIIRKVLLVKEMKTLIKEAFQAPQEQSFKTYIVIPQTWIIHKRLYNTWKVRGKPQSITWALQIFCQHCEADGHICSNLNHSAGKRRLILSMHQAGIFFSTKSLYESNHCKFVGRINVTKNPLNHQDKTIKDEEITFLLVSQN